MNKKQIFQLFFLVLACLQVSTITAQTQSELEAQRRKIQAEIIQVNQLLFMTQKNEKNALEALKDLNQKIDIRTRYIASIDKEAKFLSAEINKNERTINKLTKNLEALKKDYAALIFKSYKSRSKQSRLLFLLSSQSFRQAYKRLLYMKQYAVYQKKQGEEIRLQTVKIQQLNDSLVLSKKAKDKLILTEKEQQEKIKSDKNTKEDLIVKIKKREKQYRADLKKKQELDAILEAKIDKIIKDAIAKSNAKKGEKTTKSKEFALTPEAKKLAAAFEKNKGKLPWPVEHGLVVRRFGKQPHPTLKGITINSPGLHIATDRGADAKSVFDGKVLAIQLISGGKKAVLIQHGNYITAYYNLETLYVNTGDQVVTGQRLGRIFTNKVTGKTILIFAIHKELLRQDPADWIIKR